MSITVKPEIFQQTKQTILKNKQQFIQIQLSQVIKRINKLKLSNSKLKTQIKQLKQIKCKQKQKVPISKNKISLINKASRNMKNKQKDKVKQEKQEKQKQNKCSNYTNNYQQVQTDNNGYNRIQNSKQFIEKEQTQLKQLQNLCNNQQKQKEKQLEYFEDYIKILKKMWQDKQNKARQHNISQNLSNNNTKIWDLGQNSLDSLRTVAHQKYYTDRIYQIPNQNMMSYNHENSNIHSNSSLNCSSLNESIQSGMIGNFNDQTFGKGLVKRKTMSLSLNNSIQAQPSVFNFGKKLINKAKMQQPLQINHLASKFQAQTQRPFLLQNCMKPRHSQNLNSSLLSHSQSRSCISNIPKGNLQTSASSSTSQLKRIQPSKSYAKIITKLQCTICHIEYRPNQYYMHLNECRQLEKIRLLHQKSRIEDEINQTLNLSFEQL